MFAAIASGNPLQLSAEVPNSNGLQHTIILSETKPKSYSHITLFILPTVALPPEYSAIVYFKLSPQEDFQLFGELKASKPSAIFKVKLPTTAGAQGSDVSNGLGEIDMEDGDSVAGTAHNISELIIGISIEPQEQAAFKLEEAKQAHKSTAQSGALVVSRNQGGNIATPGQLSRAYPLLTQQLASKIVQHAYNFLSGFLDERNSVPIKKFEAWWEKFQKRLQNDATFIDEVTSE
ncbi:AEL339Cp [Eremothecium gossypii ATCC 10895]|uniref:AEL339Cp n=1 Tax=Eremothecium gossypii (strain ATCC 10895 / CBS 109.51 / FGSC 9923 / NRRL Y-1056) TaxID=284811 RepID=Q758U1_EREGS|nr:AEL339Cp [Eremothecium gossypii ATCC 10895]AAS52345.1 AEL339Cp [Eremothecium gossypii ATCC 10895]AEY96642.1 FAEL339Cp [Eremothecium gossypii FDAG1]